MAPKTENAEWLHAMKYRSEGETHRECMNRNASALTDDEHHYHAFREITHDLRFLPGGRIQAGAGSARQVTCHNCYLSGQIEDNSDSILLRHNQAYRTLRMGGGIGYDFSRLRPSGSLVRSLDSQASGPVSFMEMFHACCKTVQSAGLRRGAQMAVLRVDHPDIEKFIDAKHDQTSLTTFNISVGVTDEFMQAVLDDRPFTLRFEGQAYREIDAKNLWERIMRSTWDWGEPGVLFLDSINRLNNLEYCEEIFATNPCGEQPLPPFGACLLGSFNLARYVGDGDIDLAQYALDVGHVVRAMDNVIEESNYPLHEQEQEALMKRRMGLGVTGVANAIEAALGRPSYGDPEFIALLDKILSVHANLCYTESAKLAAEKGSFPLYKANEYLTAPFISQKLSRSTWDLIEKNGIRNSHLTSIAPTGTISLCADNVSSGIEPVLGYEIDRTFQTPAGPVVKRVKDYGREFLGIEGRVQDDVTLDQHLAVLATAQKWTDSAVSKTFAVPSDTPWEDFKALYEKGWKLGCKGMSTFTVGGSRDAMMCSVTGECE